MFRKLVINVIIIAGLVGIHSTSAGVPGTELYLVSAARTQGAQGSQWYTKVWIHNLSSTDPAHITVAYLERDQSNTSPNEWPRNPVPSVHVQHPRSARNAALKDSGLAARGVVCGALSSHYS